MSKKPHTETTNADKTALGFDFQYYFFILKLLHLKPGESIGLEVIDDVHTTTLDNDCQIYYQVKHTIHENIILRQETLTYGKPYLIGLRLLVMIMTDVLMRNNS